MREELVSFQVAKLARVKGFDWRTENNYGYLTGTLYDDPVINDLTEEIPTWLAAPTQSLLQKWIREVHDIRVLIDFETIDDSETAYTFKIVKYLPEGKGRKKDTWDFYETTYSFNQGGGWYKTYEETLEIGLQESLKLIKTSHL